MQLEERIKAFIKVGEEIKNLSEEEKQIWASQARANNNWFTTENIQTALVGIATYLQEDKLREWLTTYKISQAAKKVGLVMAGNIPAVGFHDFLCVLISGHNLYAKFSSQDTILIRKIASLLINIEPRFAAHIHFIERLNEVEAIIATGSDNSARYFKYYFSKIPNIIRQNRTSCAIISGNENVQDFAGLGKDIFQYFGLGCRNVSKLFVPENYNFDSFFQAVESFRKVSDHNKFTNNYDYNKSILLVNRTLHLDNGFLLLTENEAFVSPISVVYYEYYKTQEELQSKIKLHQQKIQCIVSKNGWFPASIPFGEAQKPQVWDYSDGIDTMQFLTAL